MVNTTEPLSGPTTAGDTGAAREAARASERSRFIGPQSVQQGAHHAVIWSGWWADLHRTCPVSVAILKPRAVVLAAWLA